MLSNNNQLFPHIRLRRTPCTTLLAGTRHMTLNNDVNWRLLRCGLPDGEVMLLFIYISQLLANCIGY